MTSPPDTTATAAPVNTTEPAQQPASAIISPEQPVAAEPAYDEHDDVHSGDEDSLVDTTASISSSILNYRTIHGRTYHSERGNAQYWGSNDSRQNESMDLAHHALTLAIGGKLHLAPLGDNLKKVVDIGTGPGLWAIDFADEHPETFVIGTDISPIQPGWIPPNLEFQMEDCTQEWTFAPGSLDFVHMRYLTGSIIDWNQLFAEAFRSCRSGGYVESFEASPYMISDDETVLEGSAMDQWGKLFVEGSKTFGRTFTMVDDGLQRSGMEAAGFVDIDEFTVKSPIGRWPKDKKLKEVGRFAQATLEQDTEGWVSFMAATQGWTREEVLVYAARLRKEIRDPSIHGYFTIKVVWGRKP